MFKLISGFFGRTTLLVVPARPAAIVAAEAKRARRAERNRRNCG